jgi:hypothetical protein
MVLEAELPDRCGTDQNSAGGVDQKRLDSTGEPLRIEPPPEQGMAVEQVGGWAAYGRADAGITEVASQSAS